MWESVGNSSMSEFFFSGSSVAKVDEKGRFVLPQEMRYGLVENGKCEFVIGIGLGSCLAIYRKSAIEKIVEKFKKNQHVAKFQKFFTLFFSTLFPTECDKVGRVHLPMALRALIGGAKELVVAGVMDKIEIWPKEVYEKNLQGLLSEDGGELANLTQEAFSLLVEDGDKGEKAQVVQEQNPLYLKDSLVKKS